MVLNIHEPIEVSAVFTNSRLKPVSFVWNRRHYKIEGITGVYKYLIGVSRCFGYTVKSGGRLYEISLNTGEMMWRLEKIHG